MSLQVKTTALSLTFSPDGKQFVVMGADRKVRVFHFLTGRLYRVFDEALSIFIEQQQVSRGCGGVGGVWVSRGLAGGMVEWDSRGGVVEWVESNQEGVWLGGLCCCRKTSNYLIWSLDVD